jgi:hypothetical protein
LKIFSKIEKGKKERVFFLPKSKKEKRKGFFLKTRKGKEKCGLELFPTKHKEKHTQSQFFYCFWQVYVPKRRMHPDEVFLG